MKLDYHDLKMAVRRLPNSLIKIMKEDSWKNQIFVGGGYLRSIVAGEQINDVDVFVQSKDKAKLLAYELCNKKEDIVETDNAYTLRKSPNNNLVIQIIHRWVFEKPEDVSNSFDFTNCCAVIYLNEDKHFDSFCDERFYIDIASKRLVYREPIRNEDAGGSILRVLKYYQKGYRIPLDSLGAVIARLMQGVDLERCDVKNEKELAFILTGLLREVDPLIDPEHIAHLETAPKTESNQITIETEDVG